MSGSRSRSQGSWRRRHSTLLNRLETTLLAGAFGVGLSLPLFTVGVDGAGVTGGLKSEVGGAGVDGGTCGGAGALGGL